MAVYRLERANLDYHRERVLALTPESERQWGEMTVERMMRHLRKTMEISLDECERPPRVLPPVIGSALGYLIFYKFTNWPKGKVKAPPEFTPEDVGAFAEEQQLLLDAFGRFVDALEAEPRRKTFHPAFGLTPLSNWAQVHGAHNNHHYRQFGVA